MSYIRYKSPREVLGEYLATNYNGKNWDDLYNEKQKEYWYQEADKLLEKLRVWNFR
jgi:hypothetical protein